MDDDPDNNIPPKKLSKSENKTDTQLHYFLGQKSNFKSFLYRSNDTISRTLDLINFLQEKVNCLKEDISQAEAEFDKVKNKTERGN